MKRVAVMAGLTLATAVALVLMSGLSASGANHGQVCTELSSGKIDVDGDHKTVTVTAPDGFTITGFCVKAGSIQQGNGPHYVTLDTPSPTVTFGHPSGKDVSHYAVSWVAVTPEPEPTPTPAPEPEDKLFENAGETFTCEAWVFWVEKGFYEKTYDPEANVWVFASEPTITETERTEHPTTDAEKRARGCFVPPTLAETGAEFDWWNVLLGGVLLGVGAGGVVVASIRREH